VNHSHWRAGAALVVGLALVGCQAGPAGSAAPGATSPQTGPSGTSSSATPTYPSSLPPSPIALRIDGDGPIIKSSDGPEGSAYALVTAAARDRDGSYVLVIVWFRNEPGSQIVSVARSPDLKTWSIGKTPIYTYLQTHYSPPGPIPQALMQLDDGTWLLYGWAASSMDPYRYFTWRATAPKPEGPWAFDELHSLEPGPHRAWDAQFAGIGAVQRGADGWLGWYEGQPPGKDIRGNIGLATSADGIIWSKRDDPATTDATFVESDPVMATGICGQGTSQAVQEVQVERWRDGYVALFGGADGPHAFPNIFGATSVDGVAWSCASLDPVLAQADIAGSQGLHSIQSVPIDGEEVGLFVESLGHDNSDIWLGRLTPAG